MPEKKIWLVLDSNRLSFPRIKINLCYGSKCTSTSTSNAIHVRNQTSTCHHEWEKPRENYRLVLFCIFEKSFFQMQEKSENYWGPSPVERKKGHFLTLRSLSSSSWMTSSSWMAKPPMSTNFSKTFCSSWSSFDLGWNQDSWRLFVRL